MQSIVFIKISEKILQIKFESNVQQAKANQATLSPREVTQQRAAANHA
jgi:hypothetical protein